MKNYKPSIVYIDLEIDPGNGQILDMGGVKDSGDQFHSTSPKCLKEFLQNVDYLCGHNLI